jgi:siroheme synthase
MYIVKRAISPPLPSLTVVLGFKKKAIAVQILVPSLLEHVEQICHMFDGAGRKQETTHSRLSNLQGRTSRHDLPWW